MSASVTSRSSITKPPWSIRLWAMNWRMKSASAGPGQATQPSPIRKRRWRSRGSSASRSCSWQDEVDLLAQRLDRVEQAEAGAAHPGRHRGAAEDRRRATPARRLGDLLGDPERQRAAGVDRAAEGDHASRCPRRGGRRRPGSRTSRPGSSRRGARRGRSRSRDPVDGVGDGETWSARCARGRPPRARARRSRRPRGRRRARAGRRPRSTPARRRRRRRRASSAGRAATGGAGRGRVRRK